MSTLVFLILSSLTVYLIYRYVQDNKLLRNTKILQDAGEDTTLATRDMTDKEKMKFFNLD